MRGGRLDVLARMGPSRRLLLVTITLLWSFACNCSHALPHQDRFYQIVQIFIGDTVGVMVLAALFMFFQSAGLQRFCWRCSRLIHVDCTVVPAMLAGVFLVYTALILASLTVTELQMAGESFFPIWMTARLTEAFRHGTAWAIMVQYGGRRSHARPLKLVAPQKRGGDDPVRGGGEPAKSQRPSPTRRLSGVKEV